MGYGGKSPSHAAEKKERMKKGKRARQAALLEGHAKLEKGSGLPATFVVTASGKRSSPARARP